MKKVTAVAHSNIAVVKYWGKRNQELNLPAVGSIAMIMKALSTRTTIEFKPNLKQEILYLNHTVSRDARSNAQAVFWM
jgi:diphosphomevalonate decarboxylase